MPRHNYLARSDIYSDIFVSSIAKLVRLLGSFSVGRIDASTPKPRFVSLCLINEMFQAITLLLSMKFAQLPIFVIIRVKEILTQQTNNNTY